MKQDHKMIGPFVLALVLAAALSGCYQKAVAPEAQRAAIVETPQAPANATVLGALKDSDWYMIVSATGSAKPLVIWTGAKPTCERDAAEFSLKAVDPSSDAEPPKAWCMQGSVVRSRLGV